MVARRLGDDFAMTVWAHDRSDRDENRYRRIDEELLVDLSHLEPDDRATLIDLMDKAIRRGCIVARSVETCIELDAMIDGVETQPSPRWWHRCPRGSSTAYPARHPPPRSTVRAAAP
ncbi:hypothetical protein GCM10023152_16010 [Agromyces bauzanensis]|uniref:Uncharacterized protein n=1 Tax=Agromyces bauzanensis TaxID=1308924 RepID=A0A917PQK4_9MICO|nr:hypothetical protein GCM10011372_28480 [Agromyces bauzanensis]